MNTTAFSPWRATGALTVPQQASAPAGSGSLEGFLRTVSLVIATPHVDASAVDAVKQYGVDRADIENLYGSGDGDTRPVLGGLRDLAPPSSSTRSVAGSRTGHATSAVGGGGAAGPAAGAHTANGGRSARVSSR